jgi:hypothetical protein
MLIFYYFTFKELSGKQGVQIKFNIFWKILLWWISKLLEYCLSNIIIAKLEVSVSGGNYFEVNYACRFSFISYLNFYESYKCILLCSRREYESIILTIFKF